MSLDSANDLVNAGGQFLGLGMPMIIFLALRRRYPEPKPSGTSAGGAILVCWILFMAYARLTRGITMDYQAAHPPASHRPEDGPYVYDGGDQDMVLILFGWLPAVFSLAVLFVLRRLWRLMLWIRRKLATST